MTQNKPPRAGRVLVAWVALGVALTALAPAVVQPDHHHAFADQRSGLGLPCVADVLSNLGFALVALWGAWLQRRAAPLGPSQGLWWRVVWWGLAATTLGSAWYHLQPDDTRLVWDRLGMAWAFAGLMGVWASERLSSRQTQALVGVAGVWGVAAIVWWQATGNVLPWLWLQLGGLCVLAGGRWLWPHAGGAVKVGWHWVVLGYGLAKLLELGDHVVWAWTGGWVSGHTLKHGVAALAVWPLCVALHVAVRQARGKNRLRSGTPPAARPGRVRPHRFMV